MPLCTHPDLPGQTAELINPDAHPGWELPGFLRLPEYERHPNR